MTCTDHLGKRPEAHHVEQPYSRTTFMGRLPRGAIHGLRKEYTCKTMDVDTDVGIDADINLWLN